MKIHLNGKSFYFYDLETSGFDPKTARVMQFAGQRTSLDLSLIGKPHNFYIKLTYDVLPDPDAVLVTGISPKKTLVEGLTEAKFLKIFHEEIAMSGTIFTGFNIIRFDDEFMRFMHYRNFYDPYEWQWQDGRSRWDLLDVVRMTRALRPKGIKWAYEPNGKPSNRLELLTTVNKLTHENIHDALSDVKASIAIARLVKNKQPKLFDYLLKMRSKDEVKSFVKTGWPFVYTSGKYPSEFERTTVVVVLADNPKKQGVLVYDLRYDPTPFLKMSPNELAEAWQWQEDPEAMRLPIKTLQFNRCPAVAPLSVLDDDSKKRLSIDLKIITANYKKVHNKAFISNVLMALDILNKKRQTKLVEATEIVDGQLYSGGFFSTYDKQIMHAVRTAEPKEIMNFESKFKDKRLNALLPLYVARNFPEALDDKQHSWWVKYCRERVILGGQNSRMNEYLNRIRILSKQAHLTDQQKRLLRELKDYGNYLARVL